MKNKLLFILALCFYSLAYSQGDSSKFCNPQLEGMPRSKALNIAYELVNTSKISSTSTDPTIPNASAELKKNHLFEVSVKVPIWNRPGLKAVIGFKYFYEEFTFENDTLDYAIYNNLQEKNLKSIGTNLNVLKPLNDRHYLLFRSSWELNGDYNSEEFSKSSYLKYNVAALFGWKPCPTRTTAIGLLYSYNFGRKSIIPALLYNNTFNKKWGLEAVVPIDVKMRHNFSEKTLLYLGYKIQGNAYHINITNPPLAQYNNLELRNSTLRVGLEFNQEIHDWLWFGIAAGLRQPLNVNLVKFPGGSTKKDLLIKNKVDMAPYLNFSVFIVPPRTLANQLTRDRN